MAKAGRPSKAAVAEREGLDILSKLRIYHDYRQHIVIMDVSSTVPYAAFGALDTIFPKIGLVIKRQFGYMGFCWGYGKMADTRVRPDAYNVLDAPVSLHIYFQNDIDDKFINDKKRKFEEIYQYLVREWQLYKGVAVE